MTVDEYWARFFGIEETELRQSGLWVVPHAALGAYQGVWVWWHGDCTVVDVPSDRLSEVTADAGEWSPAKLRTIEGLREFMDRPGACVIGPAYHGAAESIPSYRPRSIRLSKWIPLR